MGFLWNNCLHIGWLLVASELTPKNTSPDTGAALDFSMSLWNGHRGLELEVPKWKVQIAQVHQVRHLTMACADEENEL